MTERDKMAAEDQKRHIYYCRNGKCEICGKAIPFGESQLAHRISKGKIKKYGKEIIHHELNMALTCGDKFGRCNDACNIGNNPGKILDLLTDIAREML